MILKIADFYVDATFSYVKTAEFCSDYSVESAPHIDFSVSVSKDDVLKEKEEAEKVENGIHSNPAYEQSALYRKICAEILSRSSFMMHGAVIEYEGKGYLFTAKSGTGKTTHIRLWQELFGEDKVTIVNGDKPILRFMDDKVYAYGTPWCGKEGYNANTRVPLAGICFLERGETNSIKKISDIEALPRIFSQIMIHDSADLAKQMELVDKLFEKVPTYLLKCNMDIGAAKVACKGMFRAEENV